MRENNIARKLTFCRWNCLLISLNYSFNLIFLTFGEKRWRFLRESLLFSMVHLSFIVIANPYVHKSVYIMYDTLKQPKSCELNSHTLILYLSSQNVIQYKKKKLSRSHAQYMFRFFLSFEIPSFYLFWVVFHSFVHLLNKTDLANKLKIFEAEKLISPRAGNKSQYTTRKLSVGDSF